MSRKNISPSTGRGETFRDFQPLSVMRGARFAWFDFVLALFHLDSIISFSVTTTSIGF
jgi:hypothetical protein